MLVITFIALFSSNQEGHIILVTISFFLRNIGYNIFNEIGWRDWKYAYKSLPEYVVGVGSSLNKCVKKCDDFKNQRQSVSSVLNKSNKQSTELSNLFNFYTLFKISLKARTSFWWT
jgi:hypothetical protein